MSDVSSFERDNAPQILHEETGEAEVVFAEPATPTTPNKTSSIPQSIQSPENTLPAEDDFDVHSFASTTSSVSLTKDLQSEQEMKGQTKRRIAILVGVILVLLAIILGIIFGTKNKRDSNSKTKSANNDGSTEGGSSNFLISNDECETAAPLLPDGSKDVGSITASSTSTFNIENGWCGDATFDGGPGKWYVVSGAGRTLNLTACETGCTPPESALVVPEVSIFVGSCDGLYCVDGVSRLQQDEPFQFSALLGQTYYIYVQGAGDDVGLFEISLDE